MGQGAFRNEINYEPFPPNLVIVIMNYTLRIALLSVAASAIAAAATYKVTLPIDVTVDGQPLKAGDYRVDVNNDTAVLQRGKQKIETKVRTENVDKKFGGTSVRYVQANGTQYNVAEISIGGTKTKLVFDGTKAVGSGL